MKYRKVCAFAKKWIAVFQNPNIRELEISENQKFAQDCFSLGFPMDCGQAFERMYPGIHLGNADELQRVIDTVDDIRLLGSAIFSRWRYYTHWAMGGEYITSPESRRWFIMALDRLAVISNQYGDYYVPFFGKIKKFSLRSNCLGYGLAPDPSEVVEQLLTITDSGKIYITEYCFGDGNGYIRHSRAHRKVNPEKINWIFDEIGSFFASDEETCRATDVGEWELILTSQNDVDYTFSGSLISDDGFFSEMSYHLRKALDIQSLFLFDGMCDKDWQDSIWLNL